MSPVICTEDAIGLLAPTRRSMSAPVLTIAISSGALPPTA
jgi:hypothetical protein